MNQTRTIRLPIHIVKELNLYLRAARQVNQYVGSRAYSRRIAELVDRPVDDVKRLLSLNERVTSIDVPVGKDADKPLLETIPDERNRDPAKVFTRR